AALQDLRGTHPDLPIIFDPVMIATSGAMLTDDGAVAALDALIALATLVTPNLPELAALGGEAALSVRCKALLIKGGHGAGELLVDRLVGPGGEIARWEASRITTRHTHGTGCTLASAIACGLGQGMTLIDAIERARNFVRAALLAAPGLGQGAGPMGHHAVRDLC
ncbi:MAG: bifunctional hydroxymethylpyrimidine kinase/phosphomethylpyrimidine kinase, partial [Alphaproteobacteria bacterium]|nr:bifunctional hydroxymethylpyrimidine kinase/phosphomethylpyrimidine kinase [Alphaproteobacteria bacterium]